MPDRQRCFNMNRDSYPGKPPYTLDNIDEHQESSNTTKKRKKTKNTDNPQLTKSKRWKHWVPKDSSFEHTTSALKPPESFQKTIWELSNAEFYRKMRMQKSTFLFVENLIQKDPVFLNDSKNAQIEVRFQLFIALYRLGCSSKETSISMIANEAGIANGTVSLYTERVLTALNNVAQSYICWPNVFEKKEISSMFARKHNMKSCIGILASSQTLLSQRPAIFTKKYKTSNGYYGVNSLVVCDNRKYIRYLSNLYPGSEFPKVMWEDSPIINNPDRYFTEDQYIVSTFEITQTKYALHLKSINLGDEPNHQISQSYIEERNTQVEAVSNIVSETLSLWKNRWGSLYKIKKQMKKPEDFKKIENWIMATAVLHNIACEHEGNWVDG